MRRYSQFGVTPARDLRLPNNGSPFSAQTVIPRRRQSFGQTLAFEHTLPSVGSANTGAFVLTADSGTFTWTGTAATLTLAGGSFTLTADPGTLTWTGTAATLTLAGDPVLQAFSGAFHITGSEVGLHWSGENPHRLPSFPMARTDGNGYLEITLSLAKGSDGPLTPLGHLDVHVDSSGRLLCVKGN